MENPIIDKIYDLYVMEKYKYLILRPQGHYETVTYKPSTAKQKKERRKELRQKKNELQAQGFLDPSLYIEKNKKPLLPYLLQAHLEGKLTIGVFSSMNTTKFICFDVDIRDAERAKEAVYKLVEGIIQFGIPKKYIHVSSSGNKGYHVEVFFNSNIQFDDVMIFFHSVLRSSGLENITYGKVELRPEQNQSYGVKIPLGCNFKNPDWRTQECWYCDLDNDLMPLRDHGYILGIEKFSATKFLSLIIVANMQAVVNADNGIIENVKQFRQAVCNYQPLEVYRQNIDIESTLKRADDLLQKGLQYPGTRHNSLLLLAKYLRNKGLLEEECRKQLIQWMERQDKGYYKSTWNECLYDIDLIVKYTFERKYSLVCVQETQIKEPEIQRILSLGNKNKMLLIFAMTIHSKRYATQGGVFYMSYGQMQEATGLSFKTVVELVKQLESAGYLEVIERNKGIFDVEKGVATKSPNKYRIIAVEQQTETMGKAAFKVCSKNCGGCMFSCLCHFYPDMQLKKLFSRSLYTVVKAHRGVCSHNPAA